MAEAGDERGRDAAARRRLTEVFGDVLPEQTQDDADERSAGVAGGSSGASGGTSDDWLRREVPPHHGS